MRGAPDRPGQESALPGPLGGGEPRPVPAHARRRVPRRRPHAAREDRHGRAQRLAARPGALPHPPRLAPSHGRPVVHLPDVRLRPRPERLHRGHHPQHLHARVRGAPAAVRLDPRGPRAAPDAAAPARVRAPQRDLHRDEQAQAAAARAGGARAGLGRPAHADHLGHAAARLSRPRRSARSATASASPSARTWSSWGCWSTSCARTSTAAPRAPWRCCGRSGW